MRGRASSHLILWHVVTEAKLATQVSNLQGKIEFCEDRINQVVYQLYELIEAEIKIVKGL